MTKDVMISIRGIQFDNGQDGEKIESIQKGEYYHKNNTHYIMFEEIIEGMDDPVKSMIFSDAYLWHNLCPSHILNKCALLDWF